MARIFIDNKSYQIKDGINLLEGCLNLGLNLPYFCWHPAMGSVGACRQCAVKQYKDESDTHGRIVMACMTAGVEGSRISIDDPEVRDFRATVIEGLMINHPHDCPVCDEGGECHLQDMTVMTGHNYRRFHGLKRTFENQYLGPLVNQEMNRCIQCYRCTRFYNDYAGGHDFGPFVLRNLVFFGRAENGVLESEFSGNLVEVCPTGVFTDKTFKQHFTRNWDLTNAPSVCVNCSLGCNTIASERYGGLRRIRNRYNSQVNGYFLCDRGRYGYEFVNSDKRVKKPYSVIDGRGSNITHHEAVSAVVGMLARGRAIGIGSPRASLEANFALRTLVGADNFYSGMSGEEHRLVGSIIDILRKGPAKSPSMDDVRRSDAVFVLGADVTNVAPMLDLSIRQALRNAPMENTRKMKIPEWDDKAVRELMQGDHGPLYVAFPRTTKLDEVSTGVFHGSPDDIARLGCAVANAIDPTAPAVKGLSKETLSLAKRIADALQAANRPLVVSGLGCASEAVIEAAANVANALSTKAKASQLCYTMPEVNTFGLGLLGGKSLEQALWDVHVGNVKTVVVVENDLYRRDQVKSIDALFRADVNVIVVDHLLNPTARRANLLLPAATFAESNGIFVNNEGRAQRFYQVYPTAGDLQASWKWIRDVMAEAGWPHETVWENDDAILSAIASSEPVFEGVDQVAPPAEYRIVGQKIARESHRFSGRTSMRANVAVSEPKPPEDPETPFSFTMEGYQEEPPPALISRYWSPGWNSVQALNRFQEEIAGPVRGGDPGKRLIEPAAKADNRYFETIPDPFDKKEGELLLVPMRHIFGSEELSAHTPGIAELTPSPYLAINPNDAGVFHVKEGDEVEVKMNEDMLLATVRFDSSLESGLAGIPVGLPAFPAVAVLGRYATIRRKA